MNKPPFTKNVLSIDCASSLLCLGLAGPKIAEEIAIEADTRHAELLIPEIDALLLRCRLKPDDIGVIVCGKGPGSFTGLRIAMATAKGMAAALGIPLISVPALDAIAAERTNWTGPLLAILDARKKRFYAGFYLNGVRRGNFHDLSAADLLLCARDNFSSGAASGDFQAGNIALATVSGKILATGPDARDFERALKGVEVTSGASENPEVTNSVSIHTPDLFTDLFEYDPEARRPWGLSLARLGWEAVLRGELDGAETAPLYVRESDADLGITRPRR